MMKSEFEILIGEEVGEEIYSAIEFVYTWYPTLSEVDGKQQIADIFMAGGMAVINDMIPRAVKHKQLDDMRMEIQAKLRILNEKKEELKTIPEVSEFELEVANER